jgi:4'-phosphopantetheinyl transferase EntD
VPRIDCPYGTLVIGAELPALHADERAHVATLAPVRQREFMLGRSAMRAALGLDVPILPDDRGAPLLPTGWVGSISHKGDLAGALVAHDEGARVGLDLELAAPSRLPIERRILTARERDSITGAHITLAFSIKEAIYKAIDPYVRRYVGFTEVDLVLGERGICTVTTALPFRIEAWWCEHAGHWVAAVRARPST